MSERKHIGKLLSQALVAANVETIIASPGSRNALLIRDFVDDSRLKVISVVDERQAAFIGLGIARAQRRPVALLCTSGSALLNYAPALAEAFYSEVPLIVVSADRPSERIGQNDGQTIVQQDALNVVVKRCMDLEYVTAKSEEVEHNLREFLNLMYSGATVPVHINVHLPNPADILEIEGFNPAANQSVTQSLVNEVIDLRILKCESPLRCILYFGPMEKDLELKKLVEEIAQLPGIICLADFASNLSSCPLVITCSDGLITNLNDTIEVLSPNLLITFGGTPTSTKFKSYITRLRQLTHLDVNPSDDSRDTYFQDCTRIRTTAKVFLRQFKKIQGELNFDIDFAKFKGS